MKAIRIHEHGTKSVLKIEDIDKPVLQQDKILVRMQAAALNHLDLFVREGIPGVPLPLIMGSDGAGIIEQIGGEVARDSKFKTGDKVFIVPYVSCGNCTYCQSGRDEMCRKYRIRGEHLDGTLSEYMLVSENDILAAPSNLSVEEIAAFPLASMTAYRMLIKRAQLKENQTVFIWGAASGIGSFAVQFAENLNCTIFAAAGNEEKTRLASQLGADYVFNYKIEDIGSEIKKLTHGKGVDVVFEHPGAATFPLSLKILAKGGTIVTCGATTGARVTIDLRHLFIKQQQIIGSTMGNKSDLLTISQMIKDQKIFPQIGHIFDFFEIQQAHELLELNKQTGKVVIRIPDFK